MTPHLPPAPDALVRRFRKEAAPWFPDNPRTVVAVSGGADSLALMLLLHASGLVTPERLTIAHFDHAMRPDSAEEARFTQTIAHALGLTWIGGLWSAPPATGNRSAQARQARYDFLLNTANQCQASHLAVGHHLDDQAETFLERVLRGSGPQGLAAMAISRPLTDQVTLVRPLLFLRHRELTHWLDKLGITWKEDPSNQNPRYLRARIRHQLLPGLQTLLQQDPTEQLAATAWRMARTNEALEWSLERLWPDLEPEISADRKKISLSWQALKTVPDELARRALLRCHQTLTDGAYPPGSRASTLFAHMMRSKRRRWSMAMSDIQIQRNENRLLFILDQTAPREQQNAIT